MVNPPALVCLTPVRNEAWRLEPFLSWTRRWADLVIVADQQSTDATRDIAASFDHVVLIDNPIDRYDEIGRQKLLIDAARWEVPGPRVLIALDADEAIIAPGDAGAGWDAIRAAAPGTVLRFDWWNLLPDLDRAWVTGPIAFGYVDDGVEHRGSVIHSTRVPTPPAAAVHVNRDLAVLHTQYLDWETMLSKQRWYQCWERLNHPEKRPVQVYRQYHLMGNWPRNELSSVPAGLLPDGEEMTRQARGSGQQHFNAQILDLLAEHGSEPFERVDLWDVDWEGIAQRLGRPLPDAARYRPGRFDRAVFEWLERTQGRAGSGRVRWAQRALRAFGW